MTNQHPITPPPEMVKQWCHEDGDEIKTSPRWFHSVCAKAAQWGADQELEACRDWLFLNGYGEAATISKLMAARRPKLPTLKEQALALVEQHEEGWRPSPKDWDTIRRALEALDE